jgi:hypothetical protein
MTFDEFRRLAETWGGDLKRWPEASQPAARRIAATPEGAEVLEQASQLDTQFAKRPTVSVDRSRRVMHAVALDIAADLERTANRRWTWDFGNWLVPAGSMACSALLGISLAMLLPASDQPTMVLSMLLDTGSMIPGWTLQ